MASATQLISVEEFRTRYAGLKPYFEFWDGEPVQKSMPTALHVLLQGLIRDLLREAGYKSLCELELRIDEHWQPIPDVIGLRTLEHPYPTTTPWWKYFRQMTA